MHLNFAFPSALLQELFLCMVFTTSLDRFFYFTEALGSAFKVVRYKPNSLVFVDILEVQNG